MLSWVFIRLLCCPRTISAVRGLSDSQVDKTTHEFQARVRLLNMGFQFGENFRNARPPSTRKQQHPITMPAIAPFEMRLTFIPYVCTSGTMLSLVALVEEQSESGSSQLSEKLE